MQQLSLAYIQYSASTSGPEQPVTTAPASFKSEWYIPSRVPAPSAPILHPGSTSVTPSIPVIPALYIVWLATSAPDPQHPTPTLPPNLSFGQVIEKALPYTNMAQEPYPPLLEPPPDKLLATEKSTAEALTLVFCENLR